MASTDQILNVTAGESLHEAGPLTVTKLSRHK